MKMIKAKQKIRNSIEVLIIYFLTTLLAYVCDLYGVRAENLLMVYLLGILIIIMQTKSFLATVISSVLFVITHDFLFIDPRNQWVKSKNFYVSAIVFLIVALIVNLLVVRLQKQIESSKQSATLRKKLFKASEGLISVRGRDNVIKYSDDALTELTGSDVEFFFDIDKNDENEARKWCFKNSARCGHGEVEFPEAGCKYLPIRSNKKTVGVVSIDCTKHDLSKEAEDCVVALLSQITMAIEREALEEENKAEAEKNARDHLKSSVTKNISYDIYPRIKTVHGTVVELMESINLLEEEEIKDKLKIVEGESEYILETVDNLLEITKDS